MGLAAVGPATTLAILAYLLQSCLVLINFLYTYIPLLAAANGYFRFLYVTKFDGKEDCTLDEMFEVAAGS